MTRFQLLYRQTRMLWPLLAFGCCLRWCLTVQAARPDLEFERQARAPQRVLKSQSAYQPCHLSIITGLPSTPFNATALTANLAQWFTYPFVSDIVLVDWRTEDDTYLLRDEVMTLFAGEKSKRSKHPAVSILRWTADQNVTWAQAMNLASTIATSPLVARIPWHATFQSHSVVTWSAADICYEATRSRRNLWIGRQVLDKHVATFDSTFEIFNKSKFHELGGYNELLASDTFLGDDLAHHFGSTGELTTPITDRTFFINLTATSERYGERWDNSAVLDEILHAEDKIVSEMYGRHGHMQVNARCTSQTERYHHPSRLNLLECSPDITLRKLLGPQQLQQVKVEAGHSLLLRHSPLDPDYLFSITLPDHLYDLFALYSPHAHRYIIIHARNGAGNRVRAVASARLLAEKSKRRLRIIWELDRHLNAPFASLFELHWAPESPRLDGRSVSSQSQPERERIEVTEHFDPRELVNSQSFIDVYDYMTVKGKYEDIVETPRAHSYVSSAFYLRSSQYLGWPYVPAFRERLRMVIPSADVRALIGQIVPNYQFPKAQLGSHWQLLPNYIGVHVRWLSSATGQDISGLKKNEYEKADLENIELYRASCDPVHFARYMKAIVKKNPQQRFYLSADSLEVYEELEGKTVYFAAGVQNISLNILLSGRFGRYSSINKDGLIASMPRDCTSRDTACVKYAIADLYILSHTSHILESTWSSFSEVAVHLADTKPSSPCVRLD